MLDRPISPQAIIARLEQHIDANGLITLRPAEGSVPTAQPALTREMLLQMAIRKKTNDQRRAKEFDHLRKLMTNRHAPAKAGVTAVRRTIQSCSEQQVTTIKGAVTARGQSAWWNATSPVSAPAMGVRTKTTAAWALA